MYSLPEISTVYQPIVSVSKKTIIGFEGLSRGINTHTGKSISPIEMFDEAALNLNTLFLDRKCRQKCIDNFASYIEMNDSYYLFINIDASILEQVSGSNYFSNQINSSKLKPKNIVIEINESKVDNTQALLSFVKTYKEMGYLISLDDVGTGYSNYERISIVEPDIIKVDRALISEIDKNYIKQEVFKSLVSLANRIGALIVAEGVETSAEVNTVIDCGAHLLQGYFFAKPSHYNKEELFIICQKAKIQFYKYMVEHRRNLQKEKEFRNLINDKIAILSSELRPLEYKNWEMILLHFVRSNIGLNIECAYVLDEFGILVTDTVLGIDSCNLRKNLLFRPATKDSDFSMKKYYYELMNLRVKRYISDPYISFATGRVCITHSTIFRQSKGKKFILCVDILHTYENLEQSSI